MADKSHYIQYINVRKAFTNAEYRGLTPLDAEMKYEEFSKTLLAQKYVVVKCKYPQSFRIEEFRGRIALAVLTRHDSEFHNRSKELITLVDKLLLTPEIKMTEEISDLFLITSDYLKSRPLKKIREYKKILCTNILTSRFKIELPKAALCDKHELVPPEQIQDLIKECYIAGDKLSYMQEDGPQNIWIGGFPGEIIKITKPSMMAGKSIIYRYITGIIAKSKSSGAGDEEEEDEKEESKDDD